MIADKRRPGKLVRRHFEICVFSCQADELVRGDVAAVDSEAYANWQSQLLSWEDCQPHLAIYCAEVGMPMKTSEFVAQLKLRMTGVAATVDAGYPDNADLLIDEQSRLSLKARKSAGHSAEALKLATAVKDRLPERSLLEILTRTTRHLRWFRHFGPLSGSEAKLADPLERYLLVAFAYGCNLGAAQAARHLGGRVSAHELSYTVRMHVTLAGLNKAIADVVNAYLRLDLPRL
ncbi:Tn3 family transposase [Streptosporangium minutum]|uniref:Tn3 family transposase n=1 Tax=Streptosporangium minutum TaxID=569862 RepID=UPI0013FD5E03|nr:Tn3 family transposase [Streptosporangium minutum]